MSSTLAQLQDVFRDVFEDDDLTIERGTTAGQVQGWDSLMHVTMILNVEQSFGLRFSAAQIADLPDVRALVDLIESLCAAR